MAVSGQPCRHPPAAKKRIIVPQTCYIHAGTHKTGTTYLQAFLFRNEAALAGSGLYIPQAGRAPDLNGHHNLAWQLNDDPRFCPEREGLAALEAELACRQEPNVCLTSEDFEYLHSNLAGLQRLVEMLRRRGFTAKAVLYLRPQADYVQSLFAELLRHGLRMSFAEYLEGFVSSGEFTFRDRWHFSMDYRRLLQSYASVLGSENLIVRPYHLREPTWLLRDFMRQMLPAWSINATDYILPPGLLNRALPTAQVMKLIALSGSDGTPKQGEVARELPARFEPLTLAQVATLARRVGNSNLRLLSEYGVFVPAASGHVLYASLLTSLGLGSEARKRQRLAALCR
jgi:hypothetical protein